jgi:nucleolar protein 58
LFKVSDDSKISSKELWKQFETPELATSMYVCCVLHVRVDAPSSPSYLYTPTSHRLSLSAIHRFQSTASAIEDISLLHEGRLSSSLQSFLTASLPAAKSSGESLIVSDPKLGSTIQKLLDIKVNADSGNLDLYRGIRGQLPALLGGVEEKDLGRMSLGLGHSLSR